MHPAQSRKEVQDTRASLDQLERQEWWRWAGVVAVTLLLSLGILALSLPTMKREFADQINLDLAVSGLFGLVLLFDIFAVYQQVVIMRLRRQLAEQIGMAATMELLKPPQQDTPLQPVREFQRFYFDQRLSVKAIINDKHITVHGRTSDISDVGVGAVIPEALALGCEVMLEINLGADRKLVVRAALRYRRGFHHGFEFVGITPAQVEEVRRACEGALPFFDFREPASPGPPPKPAGLTHPPGKL